MNSDEDYMSDAYITSLVPGLVLNRGRKRKIDLDQKKREVDERNKKQFISKEALEKDRLLKGLEQPLGPDNKGFSMLQKMGFKPGTSLGTSHGGIIQPISVTVKNDRIGLGRAQVLQEIKARKQLIRMKRKCPEVSIEEYRALLSQKYKHREIMADLNKSEKTCYSLDTDNGIEQPLENWFWPQSCIAACDDEELEGSDEEENDLQIEYEPSEKLEMLTIYLRQTYRYCIWCGYQFNDVDDLNANCPGPTRNDH